MLPRERRTEPSTFAISTTFNLQMNFSADEETDSDVVLVSRDAVHFFVHRNRLLSASSSRFAFLLDPYVDQATSQTIQVTEDAQTLNVMLHVIYNISFHLYSPPLEILLQAIRTFEKYGLTLDMHILPGTPLFEDIVLKTPCQPLEVYLIAAEYDLFELARAASGYLLSTSLLFLPEAAILRLNVEYLSMLYNLHKLRTMVLQHLVSQPPDGHEPKFHCGFSECQAMRSAWSVTASMFVLQANPGLCPNITLSKMSIEPSIDVSAALIRNTLESLKFSLPCMQCQQCVQRRVNEVLLKWSITPVNLSPSVLGKVQTKITPVTSPENHLQTAP